MQALIHMQLAPASSLVSTQGHSKERGPASRLGFKPRGTRMGVQCMRVWFDRGCPFRGPSGTQALQAIAATAAAEGHKHVCLVYYSSSPSGLVATQYTAKDMALAVVS